MAHLSPPPPAAAAHVNAYELVEVVMPRVALRHSWHSVCLALKGNLITLLNFAKRITFPRGPHEGQADALNASRIMIGGHSEGDDPCGFFFLVRSEWKASWLLQYNRT